MLKTKTFFTTIPVILMVIVLGFFSIANYLDKNSVNAQNIEKRSDEVRIYLADDYRSVGLIPITTQDDPSINVKYYQQDSQNTSKEFIDNLKVDIYKITKKDILQFLTYNKNEEDRYISKTLNTQDLEQVDSLEFTNHGFEERILLPILDTGA